jgi:hypothetical protein
MMNRALGMSGVRAVVELAVVVLAAGTAQARTGRYLIVAAHDFASTPALTRLADARRAAGLDVTVYDVAVGTTKAAIKTQIASWYDPTKAGYVLIVGDSDSDTAPATGTTIPHWLGGGAHGSVTDLPYACFGAVGDWYPDVTLGRIPVDTAAELDAVVTKTLLVESGVFTDPNYVKRAVFVATDDTTANANATHDWVISTYLTPAGFTAQRVYATQGGTTAQITAAVHAGVLFATYMGHSGFSSWWNPAFGSTDVVALHNAGLYGVVLSVSCGSACFSWGYGECFGEYWLRQPNKGAAAYISATTIMPTGWAGPQKLEKFFYQAILADGVWEVGPAWQSALARLYADPAFGPGNPDTRDFFEMYVLLGDPALRLPHLSVGDGDYDEDGDVDVADYAALQGCCQCTSLGECGTGNLAGGSTIDAGDLALWTGAMGGPGM